MEEFIAISQLKIEQVPPKAKTGIQESDSFLMASATDVTSQVKERARHRPIVPWLRRTEYISAEMAHSVGKVDKPEKKSYFLF